MSQDKTRPEERRTCSESFAEAQDKRSESITLGPEVWQMIWSSPLCHQTIVLLNQIFKRDIHLADFAAIGITHEEFGRIQGKPKKSALHFPFCELILKTEEGRQRCTREALQTFARLSATGKTAIFTCHGGMTEMAIPIIFQGKYHGCFTPRFGLLLHEPNQTEWEQIVEQVKDTGVDLEALKKAYFEITPTSRELLDVMIQLLGVIVEEIIKAAVKVEEDKKRIVELESALYERYNFDRIIGKSHAMQTVFKLVRRIIETDSPVLIEGETGTGKELVASTIHYNSPRKSEHFHPVNCGAFAETLLESELFGHIKGSFTGATQDRKGVFEVTDKGTIFLDEIAEMSPALQVKLLRVLQEGTFLPVGGSQTRKVDVRIISATNKNLKELVNQGKFREDLYYRINVIKVSLPPLRERKGDISLLIDHFIKTSSDVVNKKITGVRQDALKILLDYYWPGNIRELQNVLERAASLASSRYITPEDLPEEIIKREDLDKIKITQVSLTKGLEDASKEFQKVYLSKVLSETKADIAKAVQLARTTRATFYNLLKKYQLNPRDFRLPRS